jgi:hypothetical protein
MDANGEAGAWFDRLMALNGVVFTAGHHEAACNALMGALRLAQRLGDEDRLLEVAQVAGQQQHFDSLKSIHCLSSQMAKGRGHEGVFALMVRQASVRVRLLHH